MLAQFSFNLYVWRLMITMFANYICRLLVQLWAIWAIILRSWHWPITVSWNFTLQWWQPRRCSLQNGHSTNQTCHGFVWELWMQTSVHHVLFALIYVVSRAELYSRALHLIQKFRYSRMRTRSMGAAAGQHQWKSPPQCYTREVPAGKGMPQSPLAAWVP